MSASLKCLRCVVGFLRFIAICQMLAFVAIFVPISMWLPGWYSWLGLGPAPEVSAVLRYVIGGTAFFQGAIGVWLWMMVSDVERYRRLLMVTGVIYLVASPFFYLLDAHARLPLWWRMYDCIWCLAVGTALIALCRPLTIPDTKHLHLTTAVSQDPDPSSSTTHPRGN